MKSTLLCLLLVMLLAGCWTTRRAIQGGVEALLVNPAPPPPLRLAIVRTNRPPPKPYTNLFLVWTNPGPLNSFQVYSRTSLQCGQWQFRTSYYPSLTGEVRIRFTNNLAEEYFKVWWTNLAYRSGGWM